MRVENVRGGRFKLLESCLMLAEACAAAEVAGITGTVTMCDAAATDSYL